ncbi:MAG: hypothetical protein NT027_02295, partial [Proteobacteria bacterium]|nr:hypothetical protein [Pseudomonadota bacterium]
NEFWFQQYAITFIVCLFGEFNFSAIKTLKLKMSGEQHWNTIQQAAIQKLESSISALNWKLTVETQPVSQIFKFAKGLINAKPEYIAKFTLDLVQSRFGIQDTAFYILDKNKLNLMSARGRVKERWPDSIGANNISQFPYVKAAAENLKVISPGNMSIEDVPPHIVLPILDDLGNLKGVLICDNISFMELTEHLILYLSELGLVCGSAILDNGKGDSVARSNDLRPSVSMQYLNRDSFEIIKIQFTRLYGHKHSIGRVIEIGLQGIQNLHGRQNQILERLLISQVESRKDLLGVFTIDASTLKMLFSDKVPSTNIIVDELNSIFAQLGILDDISLEIKTQ